MSMSSSLSEYAAAGLSVAVVVESSVDMAVAVAAVRKDRLESSPTVRVVASSKSFGGGWRVAAARDDGGDDVRCEMKLAPP